MEKRDQLYLAFVDLTKAIDLVKRTKLWHALKKTGIKVNCTKVYKECTKQLRRVCGLQQI